MITGKGMYTWIIERCGEPSALAKKAKEGGCEHILVKLADGILPYYGRNYASQSTRDFTMELVGDLRNEGVEPVAWQYTYGSNPEMEADTIVSRMNLAGLKKLVVDAEVEYKAPGMGSRAVRYCQRLKSKMPDIQLCLSTFRFPTYHREFPWGEFGQYMDSYMPQVYWQGAHNPVEQLGRCLREYKGLPYPNLPVYPTGAAYKEGSWRVLPGEDTAFMNAAKNIYGLTAVNFWEWYHATSYLPYCWDEISSFVWGEPPPPSEQHFEFVITVDELRVRKGPSKSYGIAGKLHVGDIVELQDVAGTDAWMQIKSGEFAGKWAAVKVNENRYMQPK